MYSIIHCTDSLVYTHTIHLTSNLIQSNSETGVLQENGDSTRDLNVEPAWLQGVTGCNVIVGVVDDGKIHACSHYII